METQHKLLTVKEVVQILVDKKITPERIAEALPIPWYWTTEIPLVKNAPTMLFENSMKIAGYELHYQENLETYENGYWLTELEN